MNKRTKSFLLSILTLSFIFYSCSNLANDLQKRKNQNLFNITIQETSNGTVTAAKASGIKAGEEVILSVTATTGYELKTISVTNTQNKDVAVAAMEQGTSYKFTMPASDVTVGATFAKTGPVDITEPGDLNESNGNTVYTIYHYKQTLEDSNLYDLAATQSKRGEAGNKTIAVAKSFPGFTALNFTQETISADGNTIVRIYYDRNIITYTFELHGGNWEGSEDTVEVSGLYGATVNKPSRAGYSLTCSRDIPDTFGLDNDSFDTTWVANTNTPYMVRIYLQNIEGGDNYTLDNEIPKTGTTDTNTNYEAAELNGFTLQSYEQKNIDGDGSCKLDIYYDRIPYTVTYELNGGSGLQSEQLLYGANPSQIPVKEGYKLYEWCLNSELTQIFDTYKGVTKDMTLYALWVDESVTYRFHKYLERLPDGTDGTFGTEGIYYLFGDYPQSLIAEDVVIDENKKALGYYVGNDGNLYKKKRGNYYKIEPIKWRLINTSGNLGNLIAENILDTHIYSSDKHNWNYNRSEIRSFLNEDFFIQAFKYSNRNILSKWGDKYNFEYNSSVEIISNRRLIELIEWYNLSDRFIFPDNNSKIRNCTDYAGECDRWWIGSIFTNMGTDPELPVYGKVVTNSGGLDYIEVRSEEGVVPVITVCLPKED